MTGTLQCKIWRGLVGRLEYRHDQADEKIFKSRRDKETGAFVPTGKRQDTISVALHYLFF